jgi:hypothetical protein
MDGDPGSLRATNGCSDALVQRVLEDADLVISSTEGRLKLSNPRVEIRRLCDVNVLDGLGMIGQISCS